MPKINKQYTTTVDIDYEVDGEIVIYNAVISSSNPDDNVLNKTCRGILPMAELQAAIDQGNLKLFPNGYITKHFDDRRRYFLVHKENAQALINQEINFCEFEKAHIDKDILEAYRSGNYVVWHIKEFEHDWKQSFFFDTSNKCVYFEPVVVVPSALEWNKFEKKKDPKAMAEWGIEIVCDIIKKTAELQQEKQCFIPEFENKLTGIVSETATKNMASGNHMLLDKHGYGSTILKVENPAIYDEVFQIAKEMCAHSGEYNLAFATRMAFMKYFDMDTKMGYDLFDFLKITDGHPAEYFNYFTNVLLRTELQRDLPVTSNNTRQIKI